MMAERSYQPTARSLRQHPLPDWFEGAKLGILAHWGPPSVPAWAPRAGEMGAVTRERDWPAWLVNNACAE